MMENKTRLNKFLAHAGVCSRRDADKLIGQGRVLVNGKLPALGQTVSGADHITVNGKPIQENKKQLFWYIINR